MKKNTNVLVCGCAAIVERDGETTTSIDQIVNGFQRLQKRFTRRQTRRRGATLSA